MREVKFNPRCHSVVISLYNNLLKDLKVLEAIGIKTVSPLAGVYVGVMEHSYQILKKDIPNWGMLVAMLSSTNQSCILHTTEDGAVTIGAESYNYSIDSFNKSIGVLTDLQGWVGAPCSSQCLLTGITWGVV